MCIAVWPLLPARMTVKESRWGQNDSPRSLDWRLAYPPFGRQTFVGSATRVASIA